MPETRSPSGGLDPVRGNLSQGALKGRTVRGGTPLLYCHLLFYVVRCGMENYRMLQQHTWKFSSLNDFIVDYEALSCLSS